METKFIIFRKEVIKLEKHEDDLWYDKEGTVWGYTDPKYSIDSNTGAGAGLLHLPNTPYFELINDVAKVHDYAYSSPAYQAFHTRAEADDTLEHLMKLIGHPVLGKIFNYLVWGLGIGLWENESTNK